MSDNERLAKLGLTKPAFFVPGRIEVLGKHTDYAGGRSLLCAVDRGIVVAVTPRRDRVVRVTDVVRNETRELQLDPAASAPVGDWANYVATVVRRTARNFPEARTGADIAFANDLPVASGLSSSSALVVAMFLALADVNHLSSMPAYRMHISSTEDLAAYLASVEMGGDFGELAGDAGVGTLGGSEDHTAILCCRANALSQYSFIPTRHERTIPFPDDLAMVVAFSGIAAEKTGEALGLYNEASLAARKALEIWNTAAHRSDPTLAAAFDSGPEAHQRIRAVLLSQSTRRSLDRFDQFVAERGMVSDAASAIASGQFDHFAQLVSLSHQNAETLLGNQIPETSGLVRLAQQSGGLAASAFGAGFGGSVWAMTSANRLDGFVQEWRSRYEREFPEAARRAEFFVTRPSAGARAIE